MFSWISFSEWARFLCKQKNEEKVKNKNHAGIFGVPRKQIEKRM